MQKNIDLESLYKDRPLRRTEKRGIIARVLSESDDHPDVEEVHRRVMQINPGISIATVYRTLRLFEEAGLIERHDFRNGRSHYEVIPEEHHDHLIDMTSGKIVEFYDAEIERLQKEVAKRFGYKLVDHRLDLYVVPLSQDTDADPHE